MTLSKERRQHRRFVTRNTEYHVKNSTCVGVRCRTSGDWIADHEALGRYLAGGLARTPHGYAPAPPGPGSSLWFNGRVEGQDIITSTVVEVGRPQKQVVRHYL